MSSSKSFIALLVLLALGSNANASSRSLLKADDCADGELAKPSDAYVLGLFDEWVAAAKTLQPAKVADLYAKNAVLLPTLSNDVRNTREGIIDYFETFLQGSPVGSIDEYNIRRVTENVVVNMGVYTFTYASGKKVQARFSFVYKKQSNGKYLILEHHSSAMPENYVAEIEYAFRKWNAALQTGEPAKVVDLYTPNAVLLPTLSNVVRTTRAAIIDYFVKFLANNPVGTIEKIPYQSPNIRLLAPGVAVNSGIYKFDFYNDAGNLTSSVRARYSYTYQKFGADWMIVDHHSSALPEGQAQ